MNRKKFKADIQKMDRKIRASATRLRRQSEKPVIKVVVANPQMFWRGSSYKQDGTWYRVILVNNTTGELWLEKDAPPDERHVQNDGERYMDNGR